MIVSAVGPVEIIRIQNCGFNCGSNQLVVLVVGQKFELFKRIARINDFRDIYKE